MAMRSPAFIEMALRFYYDPNFAPGIKKDASGYIDDMIAGNLLIVDDVGGYEVNDPALKAYVEALGNVPMPVQEWVVK